MAHALEGANPTQGIAAAIATGAGHDPANATGHGADATRGTAKAASLDGAIAGAQGRQEQ